MPDAPLPLRLEHNWAEASVPFKEQFRLAVHQPTEFQEVTPVLKGAGQLLRLIGRYLAAGDPHNEKLIFARRLTELGERLSDMGEFQKVFAFPNAIVSRKRLAADLAKVQQVYRQLGLLRPAGQFDRHKSYWGTKEDWRWFLEAEARALDWRKPADLYQLAKLYSEDIRAQFAARRPSAKSHGFRGAVVPSKVLANRRSTLKRHCQSIQQWIDRSYPPAPPIKSA